MRERIVTRPDFDGVVCAVLLKAALGNHLPVAWTQPNEIQTGRFSIDPGDIVANLPVMGDCSLWFDHHISNETDRSYNGLFRLAPSAAGLVFEYFKDKIDAGFQELVHQTDKIDAADLSLEEILHPERHPYILVSMSIGTDHSDNLVYCDHLVNLLGTHPIEQILADPAVKRKCDGVVLHNKAYRGHLKRWTRMQGAVSVTDFRHLDPAPNGNRFLVYSLFPEAVVNMKLFRENDRIAVKLGHSIINRGCNVNVGRLLAAYGGGGHHGAGACRLEPEKADTAIDEMLEVLAHN
jgi:hypothetical protein